MFSPIPPWLLLLVVFLLSGTVIYFRRGAGRTPLLVSSKEMGGSGATSLGELVAVLLLGGLSLLLLAQVVYVAAPLVPALPLILLSLLGLLLFVSAGRIAVQQRASWLDGELLNRLAGYLEIRPAQLLLLFLAPCYALLARLAAGDGLEATVAPAALLAWLLALIAVVTGAYRREPPAVNAARRELLLVGAIFLLALVLRLVQLDTLPPTLSGDEASAGLIAVRFRQGAATNLLGLGWFSFPSFYFAVQSSGLWLFGQTAAALRVTSAVAGALTVMVVYWLARGLFDRFTALLAAVFLLASHFHIHFSRIGLQNIWDGFFVSLVLWGVWVGWDRERRSPLLIAGLALGVGHYFYVSMRVVPLLLLLWAGVALWRDRDGFRRRLPDLMLAAWTALVIVLPLALLFAAHPAEFRAPLQRVSVFNDGWMEGQVARTGESEAMVILKQMRDTALGFTHLPLRHWYNPGSPLLLAVPAALFLAGFLWIFAELHLGTFLLLLPLLALVLLGGFSQDAPASQRYVLALPSVAILVVLPLAKGVAWLGSFWQERRRSLAVMALMILVLASANDLRYYFFEVYDEYVLGGYNTETATAVAHYLQRQKPASQKVYFFGPPRMGYASHSTIPYLAPEMKGEDVAAPLQIPPGWSLDGPTIFVFLPERVAELELVQTAYPGGRTYTVPAAGRDGVRPLFVAYKVAP